MDLSDCKNTALYTVVITLFVIFTLHSYESAVSLLAKHSLIPEDIETVCVFKTVTSIPCPLCGLTRSAAATLHGDFTAGFRFHPLGPILLIALIVNLLYNGYLLLTGSPPQIHIRWNKVIISSSIIVITVWMVRLMFLFNTFSQS